MRNHTSANCLYLISLQCANGNSCTIHGEKLNFVSFTFSMHMHNNADVALIEPVFR